jgi:hypothetical protein
MSTDSQLIERRIDKEVTGGLTVGRTGELAFSNINEMMEVAKLMSLSEVAIPKHLRHNPGACLAVIVQASTWQMSPFAVANKSYSVNDRLAYESQMVNAVILNRAPIKGRLKYEYKGEGQSRQCTVSAVLEDGDTVSYTSPMVRDIKVKNSPLWTGDPDQQLAYFSSRAMCRRHFPDVILGVYTPEEMAEAEPRDVTPAKQSNYERLKAIQAAEAAKEPEPPAESTPEGNTAPVEDLPFTDAQVLPPEEQSQEQPEPEVDEVLTDFLLAVQDMTEAGELVKAREQAEDFESQDSKETAKNAILKRAQVLGLVWHKKQGTFISEG